LGLGYIAAVAEQEGFSTSILDLNLDKKSAEEHIKKAGLIGISSYTHNYSQAQDLLRIAKKHDKPVLIGGPHATPLYREMLKDGFDYVVRGEGEHPVLNLLKDNRDYRGLAFMRNEKPIANFVLRVKDLDSLPHPARYLFELKKYSFPGAIATSRGCASHCIFCSSRNQSGCLRTRGVNSLKNELETLVSMGIERFFVIDPNFAFDEKRTLNFCKMVDQLNMEWFTELRLDHMTGRIIREMSKSGCRVVRFGIESGSQRIIDLIRKGISIQNIEDIIRKFRNGGIVPVCGFMIGHPSETRKDVKSTLKVARKIVELGGEVTFSIQTPYPGTYLYNNAEKLGVKILSKDWSLYHHLNPVIETEDFIADDLRTILFDALFEISGKTLPEFEVEETAEPMVRQLMDGVERKSFRDICLEV
jgi:radical SAM superfamily enzyme YgiQ (UPF0313 family)